MATAGKVRGKIAQIFLSTDDGVTYDKIGHTDSLNFNSSFSMDNVTDNCSTGVFMDKAPADIEWGASGEAYYLFDVEVGKLQGHSVQDLHLSQTLVKIKFGTGVVGDFEQIGDAYINTTNITATTEGYIKYAYELVGTGPYTNLAAV